MDRWGKTKYLSARAGKKSGGRLAWLAVLSLAVFVGWLWWKHARLSEAKPVPRGGFDPGKMVKVGRAESPRGKTQARFAMPVTASTPVSPGAPANAPVIVRGVLEAQLALEREGISGGSIDGVPGSQTRAALRAFQQKENLPGTGELDATTRARVALAGPAFTSYVVTVEDLARLQPLGTNWLSKSLQSRLDFETILELVSEKSHAHPGFIRRLNPEVNWDNVAPGTELNIPNVEYPPPRAKAAVVRIRLADKTLEAFDADNHMLVHFPCSIARKMEKRPVGELHIEKVAPNPNYTFDPEVFPESAEARMLGRKLLLQPGPNNPVGTVWIGLDRPGYGIHGTPRPEEVGRTESHGCFRLANWNADYLLKLVNIGTPVLVEP